MKKFTKGFLRLLIPFPKIRRILKALWNLDRTSLLLDRTSLLVADITRKMDSLSVQNKQVLTNTQVLFRKEIGFSGVVAEREVLTSYHDAPPDHLFRYKIAAEQISPGDRVLDCACGCGYGALYLNDHSEAGAIVGGDIDPSLIDYCKMFFGKSLYVWKPTRVSYQIANLADNASFPESSFDKVFSFETIEHVPPSVSDVAFKNIYHWLKPGGLAVISVPNEEFYSFSQSPENFSPYHFRHYTPAQLEDELKKAGFSKIVLYYEDEESWQLKAVHSTEGRGTVIAFCQK